jgi:hypothetical protein
LSYSPSDEERLILREIAEGAALHLTRRKARDRRRGSLERDAAVERTYNKTYRDSHAEALRERRRKAYQHGRLIAKIQIAMLFHIGQTYPDILDEAVNAVLKTLSPEEHALLKVEP